MKIKVFIIATSLFISLCSYLTCAVDDQKECNTQCKIDTLRQDYLDSLGKDSVFDLSESQNDYLLHKINEIKDLDPELVELKLGFNSKAQAYAGHIFVTGDSSTGISGSWNFEHGHAGIGGRGDGVVIEANPGDGVKAYADRIKSYWKIHNSSIMKVRNASSEDYANAVNDAVGKLNKPYKNPVTGYPFDGYYCSELVFLAWKYAGFNINGWGSGVIYPQGIYEDGDTYAVETYGTGY